MGNDSSRICVEHARVTYAKIEETNACNTYCLFDREEQYQEDKEMKIMKMHLVPALAAALLFAYGTAWSADSPKLAAPIYKGAVPAIPADGLKVDPAYIGSFGGMKALDCQATAESRNIAGRVISTKEAQKTGNFLLGPWCFLSRDPVDKVKAYYDKAVGPMHAIQGTWGNRASVPVQGYEVLAERAWFSGGDSAPGYGYSAVSLHALPPPGEPGKEAKNTTDSWEGQEAYKFFAGTRFGCFIDAVDWFGEPGKRKPAELKAYYEKHKQIESALFQRKGPKLEAVDDVLGARYAEKRKQAEQKAGMMPGQQMSQAQMMRMAQMGRTPSPPPGNAQGTPEDAEFNAFMKKNPKVANRYVELTRKLNTLMQQGKFDEADTVDEELQDLVDANPELAAIEQRADERSATASAAGQAQENQAMANYQKGMDQAVWGTCQEYIEAMEKEAYYTLIVIDSALKDYEKGYSRDQTVIAKDTGGWVSHQQVWGFSYAANQSTQTNIPTVSEPKTETPPKPKSDTKDQVEDAVKKGLKSLKSLF